MTASRASAIKKATTNYAKEANRQESVLIMEKFEAGEDISYWMSVNTRDRIERGLPPPWDPDWDPISPYDVVVNAIAVKWRAGI